MRKIHIRKYTDSLSMANLISNLSNEQKQQLCALLGDVELTLLYKASVHGYDASAFHQRCDRQGPTLVVAYNYSSYVFGGYTSVDYTQSGQWITDDKAFLFNVTKHGGNPLTIKVNSGCYARLDDSEGPNFGQQLLFCYNSQPTIYYQVYRSGSFSLNPSTLYGNDTQLSECEVYKVTQTVSQVADKPWRNVLWNEKQKQELMKSIRNYKPLESSVNRIRILTIGPVGAGKSSFFNSINSIFMGRMTSKAMAGSSGTSLTTQFRTYPVKDGREGKPLPFVLCDTMGLEEQSGAGLDIEDISSILQGLIPDRYQFNPVAAFHPNEQKASRSAPLQERIHCVVYIMDTTKVSLMSSKLEEKLAAIRKKVNSLGVPQIVLMTKVDEACPLVEEDLEKVYISSYIKTKVQEVSSRLGVPVSCVLPVKNYSQEMELNLSCDVLLLTALQQMLNYAEDYLDDVDAS
ncbi:interferon-induced protein 44-like isoform X2 [Triplophysa dalaica]|uniref:interferon-induced protein 44-like isoform X2 n=1 Tax=Triplophysa dalaica TaxID=1582913 RepID=UPI0024DFD24E|nr:interferon-induced protein 44-like isoform X2 [Triplophysa dalaica]